MTNDGAADVYGGGGGGGRLLPGYYYQTVFAILLASWAVLRGVLSYVTSEGNKQSSDKQRQSGDQWTAFTRFRREYLCVYLSMMAADWLQGPYVYALYHHYGYSQQEIGYLFIAGFGSSLIFGTVIGSMADKYGRKNTCLLFAVMYGASCITKHFSAFGVLLLGRVLGGIATSILHSSFESWMINEHRRQRLADTWLPLTFSAAMRGNGLVAIACGVVANVVRNEYGPVAPFDVSLLLLCVGSSVILWSWRENYGDSKINMSDTLGNAAGVLRESPRVALVGVMQSLFEGSMYIFVFMWTPALESTSDADVYHGWVFASFMICVLIGGLAFNACVQYGVLVEHIIIGLFVVGAAALFTPVVSTNHTARLASFCVFETCVGCYFPCLGVLRSRYIPEAVRATVMNFFRVPLNLIVVLVLSNLHRLDESSIFPMCSAILCTAAYCQVFLLRNAHTYTAVMHDGPPAKKLL